MSTKSSTKIQSMQTGQESTKCGNTVGYLVGMPDFETLLGYYSNYLTLQVKEKTQNNYLSYLRKLENILNGTGDSLVKWIGEFVGYKEKDILALVMRKFDGVSEKIDGDIDSIKTAYKSFMQYHLGFYNGNVAILSVLNIEQLCQIIASTAIFASPEVVKSVMDGKLGTKENIGNVYASWDRCRSARISSPVKNEFGEDVKGDDNTKANWCFKRAVIESFSYKASTTDIREYAVCHIWGCAKDCRYFTSIANMVLVPRSLMTLTDYCDEVQEMLKQRAIELYGETGVKFPGGANRPAFYENLKWRTPDILKWK